MGNLKNEKTFEQGIIVGKQLLLLDIYDSEFRKNEQGLFVYCDLEVYAKWSGFDEDSLKMLFATYRSLYFYGSSECALAFIKKYGLDAGLGFQDEIQLHNYIYALCVVFNVFNKLPEIAKEKVEATAECAEKGSYKIPEEYKSEDFVKKVILFRLNYVLDKVKEAIDLGYDWVVIDKMTEGKVNGEERYQELKQLFDELNKEGIL